MVWQVAAGLAGGQIASSLLGQSAARRESEAARAQAEALRRDALAELAGLEPIELMELGYQPEEIQFIKEADPILYMMPEEVQAQTVDIDPKTRQMQMDALADMEALAEQGLSAQDAYNFMKNRRLAETAAAGREQAITENLRQRGMGGTGLEAALRMMASQGASDRLAESQAMQAAENARMRLAGLEAQAGLAGQVRGQDFMQERTNADILNDLAWRNSERARQIENMNIDMRNRAAQANVAQQRATQAANVTARNQAQMANRQQAIQNQLMRQQSVHDIARSKAGALTGGIPDIYAGGAASAAGQRQMWDTIGSGLGTAGQIYMTQSQANQAANERQKDRDAMMSIYGSGQQPTGYRSPYAYV